jgi:hypothetical protein
MSDAPPTRRRWIQFGLGTMFVLVTLCAIGTLAMRRYEIKRREDREFMEVLEMVERSHIGSDANNPLTTMTREQWRRLTKDRSSTR